MKSQSGAGWGGDREARMDWERGEEAGMDGGRGGKAGMDGGINLISSFEQA